MVGILKDIPIEYIKIVLCRVRIPLNACENDLLR
jgi:hypothetical protein